MNTAVCQHCGHLKSGALTDCPQCGFAPTTETAMLRALAMSEHYFSRADLEAMSSRIFAGLPVELDAKLSECLKEALRQLQTE